MSTKSRRGATLVAVIMFLSAVASTAQSWRGPADLEVRVSSRKGGNLAGARVELMYRDGRDGLGPPAVATNSQGRAILTGLAAGTWQVEVSHPKFMSFVAVVQLDTKAKPQITASFLEASAGSVAPIQVKLMKSKGGSPSPPLPMAAAAPPRQEEEPAAAPTPTVSPQVAPAQPEAVQPEPAPVPQAQPVEQSAEPMAQPEPLPEPVLEPALQPEARIPDTPAQTAPQPPAPVEPAPVPKPMPTAEPEAEAEVPTPPPPAEVIADPIAELTVEQATDPIVERAAEQTAEPVPPTPAPVSAPPVVEETEPLPMPMPKPAQPEPAIEQPVVETPEAVAQAPEVMPAPEAEVMPEIAAAVEPEPLPEPAPEPAPELAPEPVPMPTPMPAPEPEVETPIATVEPEPMPTPATVAPTPAPTSPPPAPSIVEATWRSYRQRNCAECRPGQWAVTVAVDLTDGESCSAAEIEAAESSSNMLGERTEVEAFAGAMDQAVTLVQGEAQAEIANQMATARLGGCRLLGVTLPTGSRFVDFQYEHETSAGRQPCQPDQPCAAGGPTFMGPPRVSSGTAATVIHTMAYGDDGRALMTVVFRAPSDRWAPMPSN